MWVSYNKIPEPSQGDSALPDYTNYTDPQLSEAIGDHQRLVDSNQEEIRKIKAIQQQRRLAAANGQQHQAGEELQQTHR